MTLKTSFSALVFLFGFCFIAVNSTACWSQEPAEDIVIREGFIASAGRPAGRGRISIPKDPLESAWINGSLQLPDPDAEESPSAPDFPNWRRVQADEQGGISDRGLSNGWLLAYVNVAQDGVWLLDAQGHVSVRVNGTPRVGDVYSNSMTEIPVELKAGQNTLIFTGSRGRVAARLKQVQHPLFFHQRDTTYPHLLRGDSEPKWGAIMLTNATQATLVGYRLRVRGDGLEETITDLPALLPMSTRKVAFQVQPNLESPIFTDPEIKKATFRVEFLPTKEASPDNAIRLAKAEITWEIREPTQLHRRTFVSDIDGSVQYYGVVPPAADSTKPESPSDLVLSLHGAGVEGEGQAACYAAKENAYVIAPTNRRAFGFDWEDWGRWDALEVLQIASQRFKTNPQRTYITGHSMGGHGTWHVGSLFPDRFAALGPSAGWISFNSYAGGNAAVEEDPTSQMMRRSQTASDTLARVNNLASQGVFILHGDADDNVPVDQARTMREELARFHPDFVYKEQPGAGHWWGNQCVDWGPMGNFFSAHQLPTANQVDKISFTTPGPHVSPSYFWATVFAQQSQGQISKLNLQLDRANRVLSGSTENVSRLHLKLSELPSQPKSADGQNAEDASTLTLDLDGVKLEDVSTAGKDELLLGRDDSGWSVVAEPDPIHKHPKRCGTFKEAFRNRFVLVYGTKGTPEENEWMMARARFDAETFWYRGNGSVDVFPDDKWSTIAQDRNVIVYGNATVNAAWQELLGDSPASLERDQWNVGDERSESEVSMLMIRPRPGSLVASVGAIGGTSLRAMRATNRLPIFSSGTGYPDLVVLSPEFLATGNEAIKLAGYFGQDWSFETGEWVRN